MKCKELNLMNRIHTAGAATADAPEQGTEPKAESLVRKASKNPFYTNQLRLKLPDERLYHFRVYPGQDELHTRVQLGPHLFPQKDRSTIENPLYTAFEEVEAGAADSITVDLRENTRITQRYYRFLLEQYFRKEGFCCRRGDFGELDVFVRQRDKPENPKQPLKLFRLRLRIIAPRAGSGWQLAVAFAGTASMLQMPLSALLSHHSKVSKVVYRERLFSLSTVRKYFRVPPDALNPLLNRPLAGALGLQQYLRGEQAGFSKHCLYVRGFVNRYLIQGAFKEAFPYADTRNKASFVRLPKLAAVKLDPQNRRLEIGSRYQLDHGSLNSGLRKHGPYLRSAEPVIPCLIVFKQGSDSLVNKLRRFMDQDLSGFMKQGFRIAGIAAFRDAADLTETVEKGLRDLARNGQPAGLVWYISPWGKHDADPQKQQLYHVFKALMARKRLPSQVITEASVRGNMTYYACNLGIKLWFKLHGIPWLPAARLEDTLVMGINTFRKPGDHNRWVAGIMCMSEAKRMMRIGAEEQERLDDLLEAVRLGLAGMRNELLHEDIRKIVVHYYKPLNRKEAAAIRKMLTDFRQDCGKEVTLYLAAITDGCRSDRYLWREEAREGKTLFLPQEPLEAVCTGDDEWMLCTHHKRVTGKASGEPNLLQVKLEKLSAAESATGGGAEQLMMSREEQTELLAQLLRFTLLNWKSVLPGTKPLTLTLTGYMARHAANLTDPGTARYFGQGVVNL